MNQSPINDGLRVNAIRLGVEKKYINQINLTLQALATLSRLWSRENAKTWQFQQIAMQLSDIAYMYIAHFLTCHK